VREGWGEGTGDAFFGVCNSKIVAVGGVRKRGGEVRNAFFDLVTMVSTISTECGV